MPSELLSDLVGQLACMSDHYTLMRQVFLICLEGHIVQNADHKN